MKRYLVSSNKMKGEVWLEYHESLAVVDFSKTDLSPEQRLWFLRRIPPLESGLPEMIKGTPLVMVDEDIVIQFDDWWVLYDKKVNRDRAIKVWQKMKPVEHMLAWTGLIRYNRHLHKVGWQTKADPEKFLKDKYWQNEYK